MESRCAVQLVTYAWGRSYIRDLLDIALPAILAPGNLPALAANFECRFTIFADSKSFKEIEESEAFAAIRKYCPAELCAVDDLVANKIGYGHSLTHILYRALHSAKQAPQETNFLFFNADWIFGAHSLTALFEPLQRGERLIVAPSYCAISELAKPAILDAKDPTTGTLAIEHRDLASLIIRYRHNSIRAKTLTQNELHAEIFDQFYWTVDKYTMLSRQMPIAIVCMRPEIVPDQPRTFWDYGTISEMCPSLRPLVLSDSDDFLMMELRSAATYKRNIRFGPFDREEVIKGLSRFTTKDHREYGTHTLVLHACDLPAALSEERKKFDRYVDGILRALGPPVEHLGHEYWHELEALFVMIRDAYRSTMSQNGRTGSIPMPIMEDMILQSLASFRKELLMMRAAFYRGLDLANLSASDEWADAHTGVTKRAAEFMHVVSVFKSLSKAKIDKLESEARGATLAFHEFNREVLAYASNISHKSSATDMVPNDLCGWYFDPRLLQPLFSSLSELPDTAKVLTVATNQSSPVARLLARTPGRHAVMPLCAFQMEDEPANSQSHDVIVCLPEIGDLSQLSSILPRLQQILAPGGSIFLCVVDFREGLQKVATAEIILPDCCEIKLTTVACSMRRKERWWRQVRRLRRFPFGQLVERTTFKIVYRLRRFEYKTGGGIPRNCVAVILRAVPLQ